MRRLALLAFLMLAGCIDFREITPPLPPPQAPAQFHATLMADDLSPGVQGAPGRSGLHIVAVLDPGRDAKGEPRPSRDDTLRIAGTAMAPTRVEATGARQYEGWVRLPEAAEGGILLSISPPAVAQSTPPPVLYQAVPVRTGSDTVEVAGGAELRLPFAIPSPPPGSRLPEQRWTLELFGDQGTVTISGEGLPPSPLRVPAGLLPGSSSGWLSARLSVNSHAGAGGRGDGDYLVEVHFYASLVWTVRRGESASPPGG